MIKAGLHVNYAHNFKVGFTIEIWSIAAFIGAKITDIYKVLIWIKPDVLDLIGSGSSTQ